MRKKIMRKKNKLLIFILLMFFPLIVFADTSSCEINLGKNAKNTLTKGDIVTLNLGFDKETNNAYIYEMNYQISYDQNIFEVVKDNNHYVNSNWDIILEKIETTSSKNILTLNLKTSDQTKMIASNSESIGSIATIKLKVINTTSNMLGSNSSTIVSLDNSSLYRNYEGNIDSANVKEIKCNKKNLTFYLRSSNSSLSSIKVDGVSLDNCFKDNTFVANCTYDVESTKEKVNIEAIKQDSKATVSGDIGTKNLQYGLNPINIKVISEAGLGKTYTIYINRPDNRSKINTLKTLNLSKGKINFNPMVNDYDLTVENEVEEITITSSLMDSKSKYAEDYTNKKISLYEGNNKISITIIAENGDENTYTLNINRSLSGNNILSELKVNNDKIALNKNDFSYKYTVENNITKVDIVANTADWQAKVDIENVDNLIVGENEIGIYVTAANGDTVRYNLYVTRKPLLSDDTSLVAINIRNYQIDFKKDQFYYDLKIKDEESLDIEAIAESDKAEITIDGNKNLINGSVIKINVKAENGDVTHYFINIEKKKAFNFLWIILLLMLLIVFGTVIIIVLMKDKDRRNSLKEKTEKQEETKVSEEEKSTENKEINTSDNDEPDENKMDSDNEEPKKKENL